MKTPQLVTASALVAVVVAGAACNRTETDANAQRTAEQVKAATTRAREQLADSWLTTKIQAQYFADEDIKARHINVSTKDAVVTLTGFVESPGERQQALETARNTDGVKQVIDRLSEGKSGSEPNSVATSGTIVEPGSPLPAGPAPSDGLRDLHGQRPANDEQRHDDTQVTARVQARLLGDDFVKEQRINIDTRRGVVTLTGEVATEEQRGQALLLARTTEGVQRVEDHLTVTVNPPRAPWTEMEQQAATTPAPAPIDDAGLATTIQAKYFLDPMVKGSPVNVSAKDGVVLLEGTVPTEEARKAAIAVAQNTNGVLQVVDRLTVARR
jgi:hyperosmotically inducible protein